MALYFRARGTRMACLHASSIIYIYMYARAGIEAGRVVRLIGDDACGRTVFLCVMYENVHIEYLVSIEFAFMI